MLRIRLSLFTPPTSTTTQARHTLGQLVLVKPATEDIATTPATNCGTYTRTRLVMLLSMPTSITPPLFGYVCLDCVVILLVLTYLQISEFGLGRDAGDSARAWLTNTIDYFLEKDLDFAWWPLVGYLGPNNNNGWGLMNWNPSNGARDGLYDGNDGWRAAAWNNLVNPNGTASVPNAAAWAMVNMDHEDAVQSLIIRGRGDWDSGARKANCPDGLRLVGVSRTGSRGLCTDYGYGNGLWTSGNPTVTVNSQQYVSPDWASGYTKYQCPQDHYVVGFSVRGSTLSSVLCARAGRSLGTGTSTTRWFDRGDNIPAGSPGGDFHSGQYKGVCNADEYIAGIAFTTRIFANPAPAAIYCRK